MTRIFFILFAIFCNSGAWAQEAAYTSESCGKMSQEDCKKILDSIENENERLLRTRTGWARPYASLEGLSKEPACMQVGARPLAPSAPERLKSEVKEKAAHAGPEMHYPTVTLSNNCGSTTTLEKVVFMSEDSSHAPADVVKVDWFGAFDPKAGEKIGYKHFLLAADGKDCVAGEVTWQEKLTGNGNRRCKTLVFKAQETIAIYWEFGKPFKISGSTLDNRKNRNWDGTFTVTGKLIKPDRSVRVFDGFYHGANGLVTEKTVEEP